MTLDPVEVRGRRAAAQRLHRPPAPGPVDVVRHLLAVQAQDLRSARLALRARMPGLTASAVDAALEDGSLVMTWLCRGTLHLVAREDLGWLHALTTPAHVTTNARRLAQLGVTPEEADRATTVLRDAVAGGVARPRVALAGALAAEGLPVTGQAVPHLLWHAAIRRVLVFGPVRDGRAAAVPAPASPGAGPTALAELARRYLRGHGPASDRDLAWWAGLPLRDARAGLAVIDAEALGDGLLDLPGRPGAPPAGRRLLPSWDPYLLGWRDRAFAGDAHVRARVHPGGGTIRAAATLDGRLAGVWSVRGGVDAPGDWSAELADVARFLAR